MKNVIHSKGKQRSSLCPCTPQWPETTAFLYSRILFYMSWAEPDRGQPSRWSLPNFMLGNLQTRTNQTSTQHSLSHCFFVSPSPINIWSISQVDAQGPWGLAFVFFPKSPLDKRRIQQTELFLKTFISPNLVLPVILERPLWPVDVGKGPWLLKGWWRSQPGL